MNDNQNEIILYQPNNSIRLGVIVDLETVWLSLNQMVLLFDRDKSVISRHIKNIFKEGELSQNSVVAKFATTATDGKTYIVDYYNLDVIISVGYRVKSQRGTEFRIWAIKTLRDYVLKGYAISQRFERIDNYVDETVLLLLSKRQPKVSVEIYTKQISSQIQLDLTRHNAQYEPINMYESAGFHDRFLLVDGIVYHIGASLKDLGKKLFAFSKMGIKNTDILKNI